ncbi:hypothetical protein LP7551_01336 [Roseibium album]|nr:hypothetical protein LP7551_01336 [Roseibium album]
MVVGIGLKSQIFDLQILRRGVGLLTDENSAVVDPGTQVTTGIVSTAVFREQRSAAFNGIRIEGQGNRAVGQIESVRIAGLQIITPLTGEFRVACNGKDGGHAFG